MPNGSPSCSASTSAIPACCHRKSQRKPARRPLWTNQPNTVYLDSALPGRHIMTHQFGGLWTRKKLEMLEQYLTFYTQALKNQPFTLHYVDAFAGTGSHVPVVEDSQPMLVPYEDFKGSVLTALEVNPGFHRYHFNDLNPDHINELEK